LGHLKIAPKGINAITCQRNCRGVRGAPPPTPVIAGQARNDGVDGVLEGALATVEGSIFMKIRIFGLLMAMFLVLAACGGGDGYVNGYNGESGEPGDSPQVHGTVPYLTPPEPEPPEVSPQQLLFLEDLEYMFYILEHNFPLFGAAERALGIDVQALKDNTRQRTLESEWSSSRTFFSALNNYFFNHFNFFGHLSLLNDFMYHLHLTSVGEAWVDVLDNPRSRQFYSNNPPGGMGDDGVWIVDGNVEVARVAEGVAQITIHSFSHHNMGPDKEIILPFLQSIGDYEHLIIDIRGNGGGSSNFLPYVVMQYLIDEPISYRSYSFTMGGEHVRRFYGERHPWAGDDWDGDFFTPLPDGFLDRFSYMNPDDARILEYHWYSVSYIYPSDNRVDFNGKIWLLVDRRNFSAADYAAVVTQQTGFATIVGEPTGGAGIGWSPVVFALPNTGIAGRFQGVYVTCPLGRNGYEYTVQPDIFAQGAFFAVMELINSGDY